MNRLASTVRASRGVTSRRKFAKLLGIHEQSLIRVERGDSLGPKVLKKLAKYYGVTITEVLDAYHEQL